MMWAPVKLVKDTVLAFIDDEALSRGAAIAFYAVTSIAPVLLIVIAIAGLAFGHDAAENAVKGQLSALMGEQTADVVQNAVANASSKSSGILANSDRYCHADRHRFGCFWGIAIRPQCDLEGSTKRHHVVTPGTRPRGEPRISRSFRHGLPGGQRSPYSVR